MIIKCAFATLFVSFYHVIINLILDGFSISVANSKAQSEPGSLAGLMQGGFQHKQNLSTERGQIVRFRTFEYPNPNPIPNPIQGILEALRAVSDFSANLKDKMQ